MGITDYLQQAYDITDRMTVSGSQVELMTALRKALRDAYRAATATTEKEGETHDD